MNDTAFPILEILAIFHTALGQQNGQFKLYKVRYSRAQSRNTSEGQDLVVIYAGSGCGS